MHLAYLTPQCSPWRIARGCSSSAEVRIGVAEMPDRAVPPLPAPPPLPAALSGRLGTSDSLAIVADPANYMSLLLRVIAPGSISYPTLAELTECAATTQNTVFTDWVEDAHRWPAVGEAAPPGIDVEFFDAMADAGARGLFSMGTDGFVTLYKGQACDEHYFKKNQNGERCHRGPFAVDVGN